MRNIDEVKSLKHELGRYEKKVADQAKEIMRLKDVNDEYEQGVHETQRMVDAILLGVVLRFGEQTGMGMELLIPKVDLYKPQNYRLTTAEDIMRNAYRLLAKQK